MDGILMKPFLRAQTVAGLKTETRRIIGPFKLDNKLIYSYSLTLIGKGVTGYTTFDYNGKTLGCYPRYKVGQVLFIREPFWLHSELDDQPPRLLPFGSNVFFESVEGVTGRKRSPLHLPAVWARAYIVITGVKVQRINYITDKEAISEGIEMNNIPHEGWYWLEGVYSTDSPIVAFKKLWNYVHGEMAWSRNDFVFVYQYRVATSEEITSQM